MCGEKNEGETVVPGGERTVVVGLEEGVKKRGRSRGFAEKKKILLLGVGTMGCLLGVGIKSCVLCVLMDVDVLGVV